MNVSRRIKNTAMRLGSSRKAAAIVVLGVVVSLGVGMSASPASADFYSQRTRYESIYDGYNFWGNNGYRHPQVSLTAYAVSQGYHGYGAISIFAGSSLGSTDRMSGIARFKTNMGRVFAVNFSETGSSYDVFPTQVATPMYDLYIGERIVKANVSMQFETKTGGAWQLMYGGNFFRHMTCTFGPELGNGSGSCVSGSGQGSL